MKNSTQPVKMTIDGQQVLAEPEGTILQAAEQNGIHIPTLCHHPALSDRGGCRICVVEVDGAPRLAASCVTPVRDGMAVVTVNERILEARRTNLAFLFAERNHNCMFCPQSGDCELQALAYELQMDHLTVPQSYDEFPVDITSHYIGLDHNRCVLCGRCVRACEEISGCHVLNFQHRGPGSLIGFDLNATRAESACTSCGACLQVCPTGALYNRYRTHYAVRGHPRDWQTVHSVCPLCGLLCPTTATVSDNHLIKIEGTIPAGDDRPEGGQLCRAGRFEVLKSEGRRLLQPMVKKADGSWTAAGWESALDITVEGLTAVRDTHGADAVVGLVSGLSANEEFLCFRDLMVKGWQTGQIATLEDSGFHHIYRCGPQQGRIFKEVSWRQIADADFILAVGAVARDSQPVVGSLIRKRLIQNNLRLAGIGRSEFLYPHGAHHVQVENGDEPLLIRAVFNAATKAMKKKAASASGARRLQPSEPAEVREVVEKLNLDGTAQAALEKIIRDYVAAANPLIVVGEAVAAQKDASGLRDLVNLALLKGCCAHDRLRLIVLKPCGNSMGAYKLLDLSDQKKPPKSLPKGALVLLEQDPFQNSAPSKIPAGLDFLAIISPYWPAALADRAHVLIPKPMWIETDGTCTGLDGSEVAFRPKMLAAPAGIYPPWQTLASLAARANVHMDFDSWDALRQRAEAKIRQEGPVGKEASGEKT